MNYQHSYLAWREGYLSFIDSASLKVTGADNDSECEYNWDMDKVLDEDKEIGDILEEHLEPQGPSFTPLMPSHTARLPTILNCRNPLSGQSALHWLPSKPSFFHQDYQSIEEHHMISDFWWYFYEFMEHSCPADMYKNFDDDNVNFEVWRHFYISIPQVRDSSNQAGWHKIHASPPHNKMDHLLSTRIHGRFDTVFALSNPQLHNTDVKTCASGPILEISRPIPDLPDPPDVPDFGSLHSLKLLQSLHHPPMTFHQIPTSLIESQPPCHIASSRIGVPLGPNNA